MEQSLFSPGNLVLVILIIVAVVALVVWAITSITRTVKRRRSAKHGMGGHSLT
jgi:hypothetical protein